MPQKDFTCTICFKVLQSSFVAQKIKDAKKGVAVKISGRNAQKMLKVIDKPRRTFASEVNIGIEEYADKKIHEFKDDGR